METKITYVALRPFVGNDGPVSAGDLIPEAADWRNIGAAVRIGDVFPVLVATLPDELQAQVEAWENSDRSRDRFKAPQLRVEADEPEDTPDAYTDEGAEVRAEADADADADDTDDGEGEGDDDTSDGDDEGEGVTVPSTSDDPDDLDDPFA